MTTPSKPANDNQPSWSQTTPQQRREVLIPKDKGPVNDPKGK